VLKIKQILEFLKKSFKSWKDDEVSDLAAALAYYALFALTPMILVILTVIGAIYSDTEIKLDLINQLQKNFDQDTVSALLILLKNLEDKQAQGVARFFGLILLFFAASGLIDFMHRALNKIWKVSLNKMTFSKWIFTRIKYFLIILIFGILWLASIYLNNLINQINNPSAINIFLEIINNVIFLVVSVLFLSALLSILIERKIAIKSLFVGSVFTAILIFVGSFLINLYLKYSNPTSAYGATSSILVLIVWINYVSQIFFFGVEITKNLDFQINNQKPQITKNNQTSFPKKSKKLSKKPNKN
jgi:membrane protein